MLTTDVENYPGFPEGIMGPELMDSFRKQAERFGAEVVYEDVVEVDFSNHPYKVKSTAQEVEAKTVIISTGASAKLLGLEAESRLMGHGVSTCATCDGFFFRGQDIAIVGGGDSAMEEATFLTRFADKVTVIHRRDSLRASKIMQQKAFDNPKIEFMLDSAVTEIFEEDSKVCGIEVENLKSGEKVRVDLTGLFVAIGHTPNTQLFDGKVELHDNGYIRCTDGSRTSVDGVFACGDVQDHTEQQLLDRLQEQIEALVAGLGDGEVLVVENEQGHDYPKTRQQTANVIIEGENRLHFTYTIAPLLRIAVYRSSE
jgi:thioredoxin reductase (NADPH)